MRNLQLFFLMIVGMAIFAGCENSNSNGPVGIANESSAGLMKAGSKLEMHHPRPSTGVVTVIHGVPGLVVDVYVNGKLTLPGFKPGTITVPIQLPEGNYYIQITPQGQDTTHTVIKGSTFLPAGANASIIAHLTASGQPTLSVYVNSLQGLAKGDSRLVVRHDAAAPAVDVNLYDGEDGNRFIAKLPNLSNPNELSADVRSGRYSATLTPAGTSTVVFGPTPLHLHRGVEYIVYAIGSLSDTSFGLLVQTIDLGSSDKGDKDDDDNNAGTGSVTVIHGVPGLVVDVYVNGKLTLPEFKPGTITDPIQLPEGNYYIQITPQREDTTHTVIKGSTFLPAGANASIIAHLTASGQPTLSVYVNNLQGLDEGKSRLIVRHDAAAPTVDVNLYRGWEKKFVAKLPNLSNPNEVSADVDSGDYAATLSPSGTSTVVFGPAPLILDPGSEYIVYAIGSLGDKTFNVLVQTIKLRDSWDWSNDREHRKDWH